MNDRRPQGYRTRLTGSLRHSTFLAAAAALARAAPRCASLRRRILRAALRACSLRQRREQKLRQAPQRGEARGAGPNLRHQRNADARGQALDELFEATRLEHGAALIALQVCECRLRFRGLIARAVERSAHRRYFVERGIQQAIELQATRRTAAMAGRRGKIVLPVELPPRRFVEEAIDDDAREVELLGLHLLE